MGRPDDDDDAVLSPALSRRKSGDTSVLYFPSKEK